MSSGNGVQVTQAELIALGQHASALQSSQQVLTTGHLIGEQQSRLRGRGMVFDDVRPYQPSDDIRHMDWRVTARSGKPHLKRYQEERERPVYLAVDFSPSMYFATKVAFKSVLAARFASLLGWSAIKRGDKVGAILCSPDREQVYVAKQRSRGLLPILAGLADFSQSGPRKVAQPYFANAIKKLTKMCRPGSQVFVFSDCYQLDADAEKQLACLASRVEISLWFTFDNLEASAPPPGHYRITDGEHYLQLDTHSSQFTKRYQQQFASKFEHVKRFCAQHAIVFQPLLTENANNFAVTHER